MKVSVGEARVAGRTGASVLVDLPVTLPLELVELEPVEEEPL